jgi:hypothetical protein
MTWIGELSHLPDGKVVECVTCSALNAAVRAVGASPSFVERERLRVASGAPADAGTDFRHAAVGLNKLYRLSTVEATGDWAAITRNIGLGKSVLIRGTYSELPAKYRFQGGAVAFSHCILLVPSRVDLDVFVVDPLDARANGQPLGLSIPWADIKAFCASGGFDCLIVPGPVPAQARPVVPPAPPVISPEPVTPVHPLLGWFRRIARWRPQPE